MSSLFLEYFCSESLGVIFFIFRITFDNVGIAYLSLFQISIFKGWIDIMDDAIDIVGVNHVSGKIDINT